MRRWRSAAAAPLALCLGSALATAAFAQSQQPAPDAANWTNPDNIETVQVDRDTLLVDPATAQREQEIAASLQSFLDRARSTGQGFGVYAGAESRPLSFREAEEIATAAKSEAAAVFEPVFTFSYDRQTILEDERVEDVERYSAGSEEIRATLCAPGSIVFPNVQICNNPTPLLLNASRQGAPVSALAFNGPRAAGHRLAREVAHEAPIDEEQKTNTFTLNLGEQMPWGSSIDLTFSLREQPNFFTANQFAIGQALFGTYDKDWATNAGVTFRSPFPLTKDFGRNGPNDVAVDRSQLQTKVAFWIVRATINNTLLDVENRFWDVVRAAQLVHVRAQVLALAEELAARTDRLFELQLITAPDRAEVVAVVDQIRGNLEEAFAGETIIVNGEPTFSYVTASNRLRELFDLDEPVLFLPSGYQSVIDSAPVDLDDSYVIRENPNYRNAVVRVKIAELDRKLAGNQTLPDLKLATSYESTQLSSTYGFDSPWQSTNYTFANPDRKVFGASVAYRRILRNRAAEAALALTEHVLQGQGYRLRQVENQLDRDFENARIALKSALERVAITRTNEELAQSVYDRALRFQRERRVTEFEIIDSIQALLNARDRHVQAQIDVRKAESRLLNAAGALAQRFAERTAQTDYDRARLKFMAEQGMLAHFGGQE
jgi:outer membrane protein TolC